LHKNLRQEYGLALSSYSEGSIPPRVSVFLARHGIALGRPTRIEERSLQPDTPVFVAGTVTQNPGIQLRPYSPPGGDSRSDSPQPAANGTSAESASSPEIIRLSGGPTSASTATMSLQGKIAAALNRAGITKPEAWAAAGVPYEDASPEGVAVEERTQPFAEEAPESLAGAVNNSPKTDQAPRFNLAPPLVLMKGAENPLFMISCHSQPELEQTFAWQSVAMVAGGAVLSLLGLYVLLLMHHLH